MTRASGEVVVVTGATSGVGRAVAVRFARGGARIGLLARGRDGLDAAAKEVEHAGGEAVAVEADVARHEDVERAAAVVEGAFGPIDVWVNNAMTTVFAEFVDIAPDEFRRVTEVTYLGYAYGTLAALRRMLPRDAGVVVQVGSALAYRGIPLQSAYCGAKHAIEGFTESVRTELRHRRSRVRLSVVHLPAINTPQFDHCLSRMPNRAQPVPPIYQPEVAADAVHWAAHHDRRELWLGWPTVATVLANRVAPGLLDRYLARTGYDSQQTDEPEAPGRTGNLWRPQPGDPGAHGRFDDRSKTRSLQLWAAKRRGWFGLAGAAALTAVALAGRRG